MALAKGLLDRMQRTVRPRHALDRPNVGAVGLHGEGEAGAPGLAVDDHRATAANAMFAADVGSRQAQLMADEVAQQHAGADLVLHPLAVDGHPDGDTRIG